MISHTREFERLRNLFTVMGDRLGKDRHFVVLSYLEHGEPRLSIEMLLDFLCEDDAIISKTELQESTQIYLDFGGDITTGRIPYLKKLMTKNSDL